MKKSEKRGLLILILVVIIIIVGIWLITRNKNNNQNGGTSSKGEYTKVDDNGVVVNTSKKLQSNKETDGFTITNIKFTEQNGETILSAHVTNKTGSAQGSFFGKIVLYDKKGNEIGRIPVMVSETENGETISIEATITESYINAYDFKLEK